MFVAKLFICGVLGELLALPESFKQLSFNVFTVQGFLECVGFIFTCGQQTAK